MAVGFVGYVGPVGYVWLVGCVGFDRCPYVVMKSGH